MVLAGLEGAVVAFRIKDWDKTFENYRSREVEHLRYVSLPVRQDSESFKLLMASLEGRSAYMVFIILVAIAARCPVRGRLADDKGDITPQRVNARTGIPAPEVAGAIEILARPDIGWLIPDDAAPTAAPPAPTGNRQSKSPPSDGNPPPSGTCGKYHPRTDGAPIAHDRAPKDQTRPDQKGEEEKRPERRPNARAGGEASDPGESICELTGLAGRLVKPGSDGAPDRAETARRALQRRGVGEPALSALAGCPRATGEIVERIYEAVAADETVRDVTKVLISRLASHLAVDIPRRTQPRDRRAAPARMEPREPGPMAGDFSAAVDRIRKRHGVG